jgi:SAM-dependent methyltransferase
MSVIGRVDRELAHGRKLAAHDPERIWGWGTPAGRRRAARRAALIARGARLGPGVRALEIGCGTGLFTELFSHTGAEVTAVELSGELLARARSRAIDASRVRFIEGQFEDLPIDAGFDAVVGSSVLHHLDLHEALPRIRALLKPGGRGSFAEPNLLNPQVLLERHHPAPLDRLFSYVSPDETAFVRWSFARTLAREGFVDVRITPFDWLHPFSPAPLIGAIIAAGAVLERLPLVRECAGSLSITFCRPPSDRGGAPSSNDVV